MALDRDSLELVERFRSAFESRYARDPRFGPAVREDREDHSTLASRFPAAPRLWLELTVRPFLPQVRVGVMTDDRWVSEELEEAIESTGDEMSEFIEEGFDEVGLSWREPPVEHYRDQGKYFYFATPLDLARLAELDGAAVFEKLAKMFDGYYEAFRATITKAAPK